MIKYKKSILAVIICLAVIGCSLMAFNVVSANAGNITAKVDMEYKKIISNTTKGNYGNITSIDNSSEFDKMFGSDLHEYNDNNYIYLFDKKTNNIKAIIKSSEKAGNSLFGNISDVKQAEKSAIKVVKAACPDFFKLDYDVFTSLNGENSYNVELWEKISKNFYTGNKVSVILTADGCIDTLVTKVSNTSNYDANAEELISETEANNIAYKKAKQISENIEAKVKKEKDSIVNKKGDAEPIVSDAELLKQKGITVEINNEEAVENKALDIRIEDADKHIVNSYKEYNNGNVEWVVKISGVESNNDYGNVEFYIKVNAKTGEVDLSSCTR